MFGFADIVTESTKIGYNNNTSEESASGKTWSLMDCESYVCAECPFIGIDPEYVCFHICQFYRNRLQRKFFLDLKCLWDILLAFPKTDDMTFINS